VKIDCSKGNMPINLSPGKIAGLKAMSDERGIIAAAAMDQRGLLQKMLAKALGGTEPSLEMMQEFKRIVVGTLTKHASAMLLDVQYGLPASKNINGKGLLLAYEKAGYDASGPEKLPSLTEGWSVMRLEEAGADGIKILIFYNQYEDEWVNEQKKAWLERIGQECLAMDIPLFLEFLAYDVHGEDEAGLAFAKRKPEIVRYCVEEFTKPRYAADVLKVEAPVQMAYVSGTQAFKGVEAYTRDEAKELLRWFIFLPEPRRRSLSRCSNSRSKVAWSFTASFAAALHGRTEHLFTRRRARRRCRSGSIPPAPRTSPTSITS
jgi:tagatose 1,6-diphosphate aldolase